MKNIILSCLFLFTIISLHAQVDTGDPKVGEAKPQEATETHSYFAAAGAYYFLPLASLNAHLSTLGINTGFTNAIGLGLDRGWNTSTSKLTHSVTGLMSFHYLLPQQISGRNDSLKVSLNGYNAQFDLLGANFLKSQTLTLTGGLGWAFGRLKTTEDFSGTKTVFLNKYFAAEGRLEFAVRFAEHFHIGARYAYRADLTKTRWTRTGDTSAADLPGTNMSGTMVGAFIGYGK